MTSLPASLDPQRLPRHVGIIMDGNGRWAQRRKIPRFQGHRNAVKAVRSTVETAAELQLEALSLYAFSTENWVRPQKEVSVLMELLYEYLHKELKTMLDNNVRLQLAGDISRLPNFLQDPLQRTLEMTQNNSGLTLNLALNYGGRAELVRAVQHIAELVQQGALQPEAIDEATMTRHLYTANLPDPDLIIRTSGEQRLSNFMLWQAAYAEFYYTEVLWPDFNREDFLNALLCFQQRHRRMGDVTTATA
jgi:undecaprenyl diphosphate synthase